MSERISVKPTPIQRNIYDVAIELVNLHVSREPVDTSELGELYTKYYAIAYTLSKKGAAELDNFLPEEIKSKFIKTSSW